MYFAKIEFGPDDEIAQRAMRDAQEAILSAARYFDVALDGTEGSISSIDAILDRLHGSVVTSEVSQEAAERFAEIFGSYFGEIIRRAHGGGWGTERVYDSKHPALCVGPTEIVFNPLRWASDRIVEGTGRDLRTYYEVLARSIPAGEAGGSDGGQSIRSGKVGALLERLYTLRHDQGYFDTGTTDDGRQVFAYWDSQEPMAVFFDGDGNLLGCEVRQLSIDAPYGTPECEALISQAVQLWQDEIGFQPKPIRVRRFALPEHELGIEDRPDHYETFLKAPELEEPDEEEREGMFEQIREWDEENSFVLYWGNDYWVNADGEVTSS